jgi:hypothetical protein
MFRNPWLRAAVGFGLVTQFLITGWGPLRSVFETVPPVVVDWGVVLMVSLTPVVVVEGVRGDQWLAGLCRARVVKREGAG